MKHITIGLVGNPNCGKTTLFNALTGSRQRVGNWPGVTVEQKTGQFNFHNQTINVVDLPGTYNLVVVSDTISLDEKIACDFILSNKADLFINIIDASNLERNLYLTMQLLEMQVPVIIALNMMDVLQQRGLKINIEQLSQQLGCPVIPLECNKRKGIEELKAAIIKHDSHFQASHYARPNYPATIESAKQKITHVLNNNSHAEWFAIRLLEDDQFVLNQVGSEIQKLKAEQQNKILEQSAEEADILIADARYSFINMLTQSVLQKSGTSKRNLTKYIDNIVLHRILGIPIFLLVMYSMFLFAINIGGAFQSFFDISSDTIFVQGLSHLLLNWGVNPWFTALIASGIGKGINTTITFAPIIGGMFLFLSLLEDSGYMARAAFVMDRFMRALGLPGKSFVPLIVGFGCNVPAIMSARTLENKRDRILTVMMSPFISCGARLAIFAVFTAAFFPRGGQNIIFALYLIGIAVAILTGLILRKTVLQGDTSPLVMELPPYHLPQFSVVIRHTWNRLKNFLWKAGRLIIPICILIGVLNAVNIDGTINLNDANAQSLLSLIGQHLTPLFAPLGLQADNWPATVGLLTGVLAKEVVIATLNTLYTQVGHLAITANNFDFWAGIKAAFISIPTNFANLGSAFSNPILASAPDHDVTQGVFGLMYQRFDGQVGAFAYLLFVLLYIPCVSSAAVMARELGKSWTVFALFWNTVLAYGIAVIFYQAATFIQHPDLSLSWIIGFLCLYTLIFLILRFISRSNIKQTVRELSC